ncbi:MAG: AAA family ATPase [Actinomycetota bacterium]|nr:AAA family ATPase [Actinomycetota bacterium]
MEFRILGPLELERDGECLRLGRPKERAVLAVLLVHANRVVSLDRLIDLLWAGQPPSRATATLQGYISNLRRALEHQRMSRARAQILVTRPPGYVLFVGPDELDARRFQDLAARGAALFNRGDAEAAHRDLSEALELWRGPALAEFAGEDFAHSEAARLEELRLAVLESRLQVELALGRHATAVAELESLVSAEPLREGLWGLLSLALYRSGRQADALRALARARATLAEELGVDPSPPLRALEKGILAHDADLEWRAPEHTSPGPRRLVPADRPEWAGREAPVVARDAELAALDVALERAKRGCGQVVLLSGEPGIGKTRLAEELSRRAEEAGAIVAWGRCCEGRSAPAFWPWAQVVRALIGDDRSAQMIAALGPGGAVIAQVIAEVGPLVGDAGPLPPLDAGAARVRFYDAVATFVARLAARRPVVIVLDDLHWADVASLQLTELLTSVAGSAAIVVVATFQPSEVAVSDPARATVAMLAGRRETTFLSLPGLTPREVGLFLATALGEERGAQLAGEVHARTDGNPFFILELMRLIAGNRLTVDEAVVLPIEVPRRVREVIRYRLERLPHATTALLTVAAVVGRDFELTVVSSVSGLAENRVLELIEAAMVSGIVVEDSDVPGNYRFVHALVRETLYTSLSGVRRSRLHARIGAAFEELETGLQPRPVELSYHFSRAAPSTGVDKGISYAMLAADFEQARLAYEKADEQLDSALALIDGLPRGPGRTGREFEVRYRQAVLGTITRGYGTPAVDSSWHRAFELSSMVDATEQVTAAMWGLTMSRFAAADFGAVDAAQDQFRRLADATDDAALRIAAHFAGAVARFHRGALADAGEGFRRAMTLCDEVPPPVLERSFILDPGVLCLSYGALIDGLCGRSQAAHIMIDAAQDRGGSASLTATSATTFRAWLAVIEDEPGVAFGCAEQVLAKGRSRDGILWAEALRAWALVRMGRQSAADDVGRVIAQLEKAGFRIWMTVGRVLLSDAMEVAGRTREALAAAEEGLALTAGGERFYEAELDRRRGELLATCPGRDADADASLRHAVSLATAQGAATLRDRAESAIARLERRLPVELVADGDYK